MPTRPNQLRGERRVLIVGAGTRFLSAMSYYTIRLTNALSERFEVAVLPMRQLMPTFLYPGRRRVGSATTRLQYTSDVNVLKGVDWYWVPNLFSDLHSLRKWRPQVVIFQWWTGTVLHTYLAIALFARLLGASVVVEFHEILDTSEDQIPLARAWVRALRGPFFRLASGFVIHSEPDREPLEERYQLRGRPCRLIFHGPFDHYGPSQTNDGSTPAIRRTAPPDALNLLYFGIIRPYKGLGELLDAFEGLNDEEVEHYWLTVVGEPWEGWELLLRQIAGSRHRARITVENRFVDDDEVAAYFSGADAVILPYRRSSASGPAHIAMSRGLPLVVTAVGGLPAAVEDYKGAIIVPPLDPVALRDAIRRLPGMCGRHYTDPHSWHRTVEGYTKLFESLDQAQRKLRTYAS